MHRRIALQSVRILSLFFFLSQGGFKIFTENEAAKQYFFCANTEKEREEWVDSISNAKLVDELNSCILYSCIDGPRK